jgi:hypothetical protein
MRGAPFWASQEAAAHTLIHDATMMGDFRIPTAVDSVHVPTLVLDGGTTPWLTATADKLATVLPDGRRQSLTGEPHNVDPEAMGPALAEYFGR